MEEKDFKYELMKSFHEQFAQNQNHHQNLFIQVVSILLTVIVGFGYTLFNFKTTGDNITNSNIGLFEFTAAFTISELILTLGMALVSNMALGYRRDQFMNTRIRESAKITVNTAEKKEYMIFARSYNPMLNYYDKKFNNNKPMFFEWMPNFHIIFSITIIIIQLLVILIFFSKLKINNYLMWHSNNNFDYFSMISIIGIFSFCSSFWVIRFFRKQLLDFYLINGMQDLINKRNANGK
jgi:hypothetical protein